MTFFLPPNTKLAAVFPGQGAQAVGMATPYLEHPTARKLLEEANELWGKDIIAIMQEGDEETLRQTENAQMALFLTSICAVKLLEDQVGKPFTKQAHLTAGHSVGEYAALCAAGVFNWQTGLKLVQARGHAMAQASEGTMAAIIGLDMPTLEALCTAAGCYVANDNTAGQVIISGKKTAVEQAMEAAKEAGAKRAMPLNVSGAFHTPMMADAAAQMESVLENIDFHDAQVPVILNTTAQPATDGAFIKSQLVQQITAPVRWRETMDMLASAGTTHLIELGSGKVLSGMAKRAMAGVEVIS